MLHTQTDTQTDGQTDVLNNITLYAPRHEEAFLPIGKKRPHYEEAFCLKAKNTLGRFALSALPHHEEAFLPIGKNRPNYSRQQQPLSFYRQNPALLYFPYTGIDSS